MKKIISFILILFFSACTSASQFGAGVNITFDPRTIGMQIDDTIMQKNLSARLALTEKKYFLLIQSEVRDGRIFLTGKVDEPEEKIKITKMAWETKGVRSVKNAITIKGQSNCPTGKQTGPTEDRSNCNGVYFAGKPRGMFALGNGSQYTQRKYVALFNDGHTEVNYPQTSALARVRGAVSHKTTVNPNGGICCNHKPPQFLM